MRDERNYTTIKYTGMQTLSPRKFVQTKARTLPLSKCMVNKDWEESQIANVSVMRKHANGNVTIGLYLSLIHI